MTLFDVDVPEPVPAERLSADRRRTQRQAAAIANRTHPLSLALGWHIRLHPDAGPDSGPRCGDCRFRELFSHHNRSYPKCTVDPVQRSRERDGRVFEWFDYPRMSQGAGTDVRAAWPACSDYELGDPKVSPDAARWSPERAR